MEDGAYHLFIYKDYEILILWRKEDGKSFFIHNSRALFS